MGHHRKYENQRVKGGECTSFYKFLLSCPSLCFPGEGEKGFTNILSLYSLRSLRRCVRNKGLYLLTSEKEAVKSSLVGPDLRNLPGAARGGARWNDHWSRAISGCQSAGSAEASSPALYRLPGGVCHQQKREDT